MTKEAFSKISEGLKEALRYAEERYNKMTPEEQEAMWKAQRESWVRGMKPTGDPRFD